MPGIAIGARPRFAPAYPKINYSHPLSAGLIGCVYTPLLKNLSTQQPGFAATVLTKTSPTLFGESLTFRQSSVFSPELSLASGPWTIGCSYTIKGTTGYYPDSWYRQRYISATDCQGWVLTGNNTTLNASVVMRRNDNGEFPSSTKYSGSGTNIAVSNGINLVEQYLNALRVSSTSTANANPLDLAGNTQLRVGTYSSADNEVGVTIACAWSRVLSLNEITMFEADPFCMLSY